MIDTDIVLDSIPAELRERDQWVLWRYTTRDGEPTKEPLQMSGELAKTDDQSTWATYDSALERFSISDSFDGIGFVFSPDDPYCGIDLDGCRDPVTGAIEPWANHWIGVFNSYTEVSPSKTGFKLFVKGKNSRGTGINIKVDHNGVKLPKQKDKELTTELMQRYGKAPGVELYDKGRYFTTTGCHLNLTPLTIEPRQEAIDQFIAQYSPTIKANGHEYRPSTPDRQQIVTSATNYVAKMDRAISGQGGHATAFSVACQLFRFGLTPQEARTVFDNYNQRCEPPWNDREIEHKLQDALERVTSAGEFGSRLSEDRRQANDVDLSHIIDAGSERQDKPVENSKAQPDKEPNKQRIIALKVRELCDKYPKLRKPIVHQLLREGETMNIIASPKIGKSWLIYSLLLSIAAGIKWLDTYFCDQGEVLLIDNELHPETIAHRLPKVADALGLKRDDYADRIHVVSVRGQALSVPMFGEILKQFEPARFKLVVNDAWYRSLPGEIDENDNGAIKDMFNWIDRFALEYQCAFALIHHASKGSQNGKAVTDVGSGAGSQSRAADSHLVLRPHEQPGCVVLDAAVRSWAPIEPRVLRWTFPIWTPVDDLDPADLRPERPARAKRDKQPKETTEPKWTNERFANEIVKPEPQTKATILATAADHGLSDYKAGQLLRQAEAKGLVHRWKFARFEPQKFATTKQPELPIEPAVLETAPTQTETVEGGV